MNHPSFDELLGGSFPSYERREEQIRMSEAVHEAITSGGRLIVEAGTGVGKSLAYLIPLANHMMEGDGRRAVVSTYTKALQRQLTEKDLPFLRDHLFPGLRFALSLGSENYLCLRRLDQTKTHSLFEAEEAHAFGEIGRWARKTVTGLRSEVAVPFSLWLKVARESDLCHGRDCRRYDSCFYQTAKAVERKAHIIVANHHLFFANVASGWNALPGFDAVVFDEAHVLEEVAADYLGVEFSASRLSHFLDAIFSPRGKGLLQRLTWITPQTRRDLNSMVDRTRRLGDAFFGELGLRLKESATLRIRDADFLCNTLSEPLMRIGEALKIVGESSQDEEEQKDIAALGLRSEALGLGLQLILSQAVDRHVYWAEREGRRLRLVATPLDIAGLMATQVFGVLDSVVLTSATLSIGGRFDYIADRLGLHDARTLLLQSPFDYERQAMLYLPRHISEPQADSFLSDVSAEVEEILRVTGGGTMVLFTSYSLLTGVADRVDVPGLTILRQGDADSYHLISRFRTGQRSVLFGTHTFWQGVDIPGDALRCVVITRLPFAVPDEPVTEARLEELERTGKNPFLAYQVPRAVILLKQGFGRLIRTRTDRGVVAILDPRIQTRHYGEVFLKSLPRCTIAATLPAVADFLDAGGPETTVNGLSPKTDRPGYSTPPAGRED